MHNPFPKPSLNKNHLSSQKKILLELMQRINYGRILNLRVRHGQPVMEPPPRVIRDIKFGSENGPRPEVDKEDFMLKAQVRELFGQIEKLGDGVISCIEVQHGLPFRMTVEEVVA